MNIFLLCFGWFLIGSSVGIWVNWMRWKRGRDITVKDICVCILAGVVGPFTWIILGLFFVDQTSNKIVIKGKRK
jgi:hypothetical protein